MVGASSGRARVEREIYRQGSFAVLEILLDGTRVRLAGDLPTLLPGTWVQGVFSSFQHPRYGLTYQVQALKAVEPSLELGSWLEERLGLRRAPDEAVAREALKGNPRVLAPFTSSSYLQHIMTDWPRIQSEYMLLEQGLSPESARALWRVSPAKLAQNPYLFVLEGLSLAEADRVAQRHQVQHLRPQGVVLAWLVEQSQQGHTLPDYSQPLPAEARSLLGSVIHQEGSRLGLKRYFQAEQTILDFFRRRAVTPLRLATPPPGLTGEQRGLWPLVERGHALLTGGPGTGKSFTCAGLVEAAERARQEVVLLAPTGKAAVRLVELTGRGAHTIHARLGWNGESFGHTAEHPLQADLVVVDEASMADVELLAALVRALPPQAHLLLVGDADQLPPVGPGAPFQDLLRLSIPQVRLTQLQRRSQQHPVTLASYEIKDGRLPPLHNQPGLAWRLGTPIEAQAALLEDVMYLHQQGIRPQVLSPVYRGVLGIDALNKTLKEELNPGGGPLWLNGLLVAVGDPLIQLRNDYSLGLANGQMMEVEAVDRDTLLVRLDDGSRQYIPRQATKHLRHAYAISIHRSQGSQWPHILIALSSEQGHFPNREMLYTALTRAQQSAWLYGDLEAYQAALTRRASQRETWLYQGA
jgi:exodeoxyribonuclease V alpha subunit